MALDARGEAHLERAAAPGYVRFELFAADGALIALTNPVYLRASVPSVPPAEER
jgi:hypothetical protein